MKKIALLACIALLAGACSQDDKFVDTPTTQQSQDLGEPGDIELEMGVDTELPLELDEESLRGLDLYMPDRQTVKYTINLNKYAKRKVDLFIKKKDQTEVRHVQADAKITEVIRDGKKRYRMHIVAEGVQPAGAGNSFKQGEWYVSGYWYASPNKATNQIKKASFDGTEKKYTIPDVEPASADGLGETNKVDMAVPLGFPWTKISGKQKGNTYVMKNMEVKIRPLGVVLAIFPHNRTAKTIILERLDSELTGFGIGGTLDMSQQPVEGQFPAFASTGRDNTGNKTASVLPSPITLASGQKSDKPLFLWAMPETGDTDGNKYMTFTFVSKERGTNDASLSPEDRFGDGKTSDRYPMDVVFKDTPNHGTYYVRTLPIRTGLMITEIFSNRVANETPMVYPEDVREGRDWKTVYRFAYDNTKTRYLNDPYFYGYVEIHNPNLDAVDLSNYALCRIANIRRVDRVYIGRPRRGPNYPYFHPNEDKFKGELADYNEAYPTQNRQVGLADRRADAQTNSHLALLLSLQLKDGQKSSFQPNSLGFSSPFETGTGRMERKLVEDAGNDNRTERVKFFKPKDAPAKAMLGGGKTMVILGNGFLRKDSGDPKYTRFWKKDRSGQYTENGKPNDPKNNTLANIADQRVVSLPQAVWQDMMDNSECQYVVAIDNYNDITAYANKKDAGVMNLGLNDALFLVQKNARNPQIRRIIDATSAHPFSRVNNWNDFAEKVTFASETEVAVPHFRVRSMAQEHPEFLNFNYKLWWSKKFAKTEARHQRVPRIAETSELDKQISPGRRSAQGRPY